MTENRIEMCFRRLAANGRKALIPYIIAGDPVLEVTVPAMHAMVEAGADIIELGIPFSDPFADGPVNQRGAERAIAAGTTLKSVIDAVIEFRETDEKTPLVLMGYLNPIIAMGGKKFCVASKVAGVDGLLLVDMPPEAESDLVSHARAQGLDLIYLAAPTTTDERLISIGRATSGYLYYVSLKGVTGSSKLDTTAVVERIEKIRRYMSVPICVGFGIQTPEDAASIASASDGSIVGTILVRRIEELANKPQEIPQALAAIIRPMREAMDKVVVN